MITSFVWLIAQTQGWQLQRRGDRWVRGTLTADRLKVLVYDGCGMWLCTRRLQAGSFAWPREAMGSIELSREQFDWLVAGLPWQRLSGG